MIQMSFWDLVLYSYLLVLFVMMAYNNTIEREMKPDSDDKHNMKYCAILWPLIVVSFVLADIPRAIRSVMKHGFRK